MSDDPRLFLWPKGSDVSEVKRVVEDLNLGYKVSPFWYQNGASEGAERVLVLDDGFEYGTAIDYIRPLKREQMQEAVEWALGLREESRGARLIQDTWNRIFGGEVRIWDDVSMPEGWDEV